MELMSARFRGNQVLQDCADGVQSAYLRVGSHDDAVRLLQEALIDLGYSIPSGATGNFVNETRDAVIQFKTDEQLFPNDGVAGQKTITRLDEKWALPFAGTYPYRNGRAPPRVRARCGPPCRAPLSCPVPMKVRHAGASGLRRLVAGPVFLLVAWDRVRGNKGAKAAGVDGQTAAFIVIGHAPVWPPSASGALRTPR